MKTFTDEIPGHELVNQGMVDLRNGELTVEALLVAVGEPRLQALGISLPKLANMPHNREIALYETIGRLYPDDTHSRYNALIRRLVSFEHELERRKARDGLVKTNFKYGIAS